MKSLALAVAAAAVGSLFGPPRIAIELRSINGSFAVARTFHHGDAMGLPLVGTAEGLANGQRRSVALRFTATDTSNVFGIQKTWDNGGVWVLAMKIEGDFHGGAGALVGLDRSGKAVVVKYPRDGRGWPRAATSGEVTSMLRDLDAGRVPSGDLTLAR